MNDKNAILIPVPVENRESFDSIILVPHSKQSIKGFIKLYLSINPTPYWLHQVLTFKGRMTDKELAKRFLKKLLDSLEKAYPQMAAFFIQGNQKRLGIHYHLILIFWGEQAESPEEMRVTFGRDVFNRWNKIRGNTLLRKANLTKLRSKEFRCIEYLLKFHVCPTRDKLHRESLWHGVRNKKLILENSSPVTKEQVKQLYDELFPKPLKPKPESVPLPAYFSMRDLKKIKESITSYCEAGSGGDWESFKRLELKTNKKVSDVAYIEFKNKKWYARLPKIKCEF